MRVFLAYPHDMSLPGMTFGSLAVLNACMKEAGHETMVADLSAEAFTHMAQPETLRRYFDAFDLLYKTLDAEDDKSPEAQALLKQYTRLKVFPRDLMLTAKDCIRGLRDAEKYYDPIQYRHMRRVVEMTHKFLNSFTPHLDPRNKQYTMQVFQYLDQDHPDPYSDFYRGEFLDRLEAFNPDVVALTCPFSLQIYGGLKLADIIRERLPDVKFVMGGTSISEYVDLLLGDHRFYEYVDHVITGDGEESLPLFLDALSGKAAFDEVPGLYRVADGEIVTPTVNRFADMDKTPTPDFSDIDFSHYMAPEPTIVLSTSRGCYYNKCTFCAESFRIGFRKRSPRRVYDDVKSICLDQGINHIQFLDPLAPPVTLEHVSKGIARDNLPVRWLAEVKFERIYTNEQYVKKLARGGCTFLQFGFESGAQHVLDDMKKGNNLEQIDVIVKHLRKHNIAVGTTWFIGFPSETEADARTSWKFLRDRAGEIHQSFYSGTFGLGDDVPVYNEPEKYGIKIVYSEAGLPGFTRLDGSDWDTEPLHQAYYSRGDMLSVISGSSLLHTARDFDLASRNRSSAIVGPTSFEAPPVRERIVHTAAENRLMMLDDPDDSVAILLVAQSCTTFDLDAIDVALLSEIREEGTLLGTLIDDHADISDIQARLDRFVDRGYVEMPDPVLAEILGQSA